MRLSGGDRFHFPRITGDWHSRQLVIQYVPVADPFCGTNTLGAFVKAFSRQNVAEKLP